MNLRGIKFVSLWLAGLIVAGAATLEEIIADPQLWPTEVIVTAVAKGTVVNNGKDGGMMLIGAGTRLTVSGVTTAGVIGKSGLTSVRVPVEKTDLLQRAGSATATASSASTATVPASTASSSATAPVSGVPSLMQRSLAGKLVRMQNGKLQKTDDVTLAGVKYYALYYSASWCGPCKQFTPGLVASYKKLKAQHPEFEIVFISRDRSAGAMRDYMNDDKMAWPALSYDQIKDGSHLLSYMGPGIPCLVLVDAKGKVISDSFDGDNYLGPQKVLADATRLLKKG